MVIEHRADALLAVDDREVAVRRKAEGGQLLALFHIMLHARAAGLLIQPEEQPHAPLERRAGLLHGLQRVHRRHHRPLVVDRAARVDLPVVDLRRVGGIGPARALRHDVQMAQNGHKLLARAVFQISAIAVHIAPGEAQFRAALQHVGKAVRRALTEHGAVLAQRLHALDAQQPLQGGDLLLKRVRNGLFDFHGKYLQKILWHNYSPSAGKSNQNPRAARSVTICRYTLQMSATPSPSDS